MRSAFSQRASYQRQGIRFDGGFLPLLSERKVSSALDHKLARDHLFVDDHESDFVGTWRGSRVQLYAVSRRAIEAIVNPKVAGVLIDRDTASRHSFGQLSPDAITFASSMEPQFRERKRNIIVATSARYAHAPTLRAIDRHPIELRGVVDLRPSVTACVRDAVADAVWGDAATNPVAYIDGEGGRRTIPFAEAMYDNFLRLRTFSSNYAIRVEPRAQLFAVTREQRRMRVNTAALQRHMASNRPLDNTIGGQIRRLHGISGLSSHAVRDDTITSFLAAVDTTRTSILATLKHLLDPSNALWKEQVSVAGVDSAVLRACIVEALRVDTPGSVFNSRVVDDFDITFDDKRLTLHRNTLVMPNIHALHASYGPAFDPARHLRSHTSELIIPFGKGPRSCPGKSFASAMIAVYVHAFLRSYPDAHLDPHHADNHYPVHTSSEHGLHVTLNARRDPSSAR
ncbi:cytochrome P450 [Actinomycetes bacterium M1A6_2h]